MYQFHHHSVVVSSLPAALHFYTEVLGLSLDDSRPVMNFDGAWLAINSTQGIHLLCTSADAPHHRGTDIHVGRDRHLALACSDFAATQKRLESHGINYSLSQSGRQALFIRDPDGNGIELIASPST